MTFKQYRNVDIAIFAVLTAVFETVATYATSKWFPGQPMAISITPALILIVMYRWGALSAVVAAVGGVTFCVASSAAIGNYVAYCLGNMLALVSLFYFKLFGSKDAVRQSFFKTLLFASTSYVAMAVGRWVFSLPFGAAFADLVGFLTSDILSLLFAVIILWIFRGVDGLIEDQKAYLFRLERERKEQNKGYGEE